jgi:hypothetical protein
MRATELRARPAICVAASEWTPAARPGRNEPIRVMRAVPAAGFMCRSNERKPVESEKYEAYGTGGTARALSPFRHGNPDGVAGYRRRLGRTSRQGRSLAAHSFSRSMGTPGVHGTASSLEYPMSQYSSGVGTVACDGPGSRTLARRHGGSRRRWSDGVACRPQAGASILWHKSAVLLAMQHRIPLPWFGSLTARRRQSSW